MLKESIDSSDVEGDVDIDDGLGSSDELSSKALGGVGEEKAVVAGGGAGEDDSEGRGRSEGSGEGGGGEGSEVDVRVGEG